MQSNKKEEFVELLLKVLLTFSHVGGDAEETVLNELCSMQLRGHLKVTK